MVLDEFYEAMQDLIAKKVFPDDAAEIATEAFNMVERVVCTCPKLSEIYQKNRPAEEVVAIDDWVARNDSVAGDGWMAAGVFYRCCPH